MSHSMQGPGSKDLGHITKSHGSMPGSHPPPKPPDKTLVKTTGGGGGGKKAPKLKSAADEAEDEDEKARREEANTPPPEKQVDRTVVKITNIHWKTGTLAIGGTAFVAMDVAIPPEYAALTGITCSVESRVKEGPWRPGAQSARCDVKAGKAECEVLLFEPPKNTDGSKPEAVQYRVLAKHFYSKTETGPEKEASPGGHESPFESAIYYSPVSGEYLLLKTEAECQSYREEFDSLRLLSGLSRQVRDAQRAEDRKPLVEKLAEKIQELFGDAGFSGEGSHEPESDAHKKRKEQIKEWVAVRMPGKKWGPLPAWAYTRAQSPAQGTGPKGKIVKADDPEIKKNLEDLMKKAPGSKEHSPLLSSKFALNLFKVDPIKDQKVLWHEKVPKDGKLAGQSFTFSKEASVCRFAYQWDGAEGTVDLKEKKFKIGTGGKVSVGFLEGKMEGDIALPEKGFNILLMLIATPYLAAVLSRNRKCLMRFNLGLKAEGFAGLSLAGSLCLPEIDLKKESVTTGKPRGRHAEAGVEASGFAGAKAEQSLTVGVEWTSPERNKFESLGSVCAEAGESVGLGGEFEWKLEYRDGVFFFHGGASLTVALGLKGTFSFELGLVEGCKFIAYIGECMDFHFIKEINGPAFKAYTDYWFTLMTLGEAALTAEKKLVVKVIDDFPDWFQGVIPDFASLKKNLWNSSRHSSALNNVPPEALGQGIRTMMKVREDEDFRAIMGYLYSTVRRGANVKTDPSANHKLKWVLRCVSDIKIPDEDGPGVEALKESALRAGIKKIEDFGNGIGCVDMDGNKPKPSRPFLEEFHTWLKENGT